jgi:HK97 family phage prohead protease
MEQTSAVMEQKVGFSFPLEILKQTEESGQFHIVGYAATSDFDLQGDVISDEALRDSSLDLLKNSTVLLNHDVTKAIGKVTKAEFDKHGLLIDVLISKTEPEIIQKIKEGVLNKFSIRGQVLEREKKFMPELDRVVNVIQRMSLVEVSLVSVPANPEARAIGWYVSKALEEHDTAAPATEDKSQGGNPMPKEDVAIEEIPQGGEAPPNPEPSTPKKEETPNPEKKGPETSAPAAANPPPSTEAPPAPQADLSKQNGSMNQPDAVWFLINQLLSLGGEAATIGLQLKALLKWTMGEGTHLAPPSNGAPKSVSKEEMSVLIASEVKKHVEAAFSSLPAIRKGLIQKDTEPDDIKKQFEALSPEKKLRVALALQQS